MACEATMKKTCEKKHCNTQKVPSAPPAHLLNNNTIELPPSYDESLYGLDCDSPPDYSTLDTSNLGVGNKCRKKTGSEFCSDRRNNNVCSYMQFHPSYKKKFHPLSHADFQFHVNEYQKSYYARKPKKDLKFVGSYSYYIHKYEIHTTIESRCCIKREQPLCGPVESKKRADYVSAWEQNVEIPHDYKTKNLKLPGSSSVIECHRCFGKKTSVCSRCNGNGSVSCQRCWGSGNQSKTYSAQKCGQRDGHHTFQTSESCSDCYGRGTAKCTTCYGYMRVRCQKCNETGKMETFVQMTVNWDKKHDQFYTDECRFSRNFLRKCNGVKEFEDFCSKGSLIPISHRECPHPDVIKRSNTYIKEHRCAGESAKVIHQKHSTSLIPVHEVTCQQKNGKLKSFCLVGTNFHCISISSKKNDVCSFM